MIAIIPLIVLLAIIYIFGFCIIAIFIFMEGRGAIIEPILCFFARKKVNTAIAVTTTIIIFIPLAIILTLLGPITILILLAIDKIVTLTEDYQKLKTMNE